MPAVLQYFKNLRSAYMWASTFSIKVRLVYDNWH